VNKIEFAKENRPLGLMPPTLKEVAPQITCLQETEIDASILNES
jgi:hypothetical protein